MRLRFIRDGKFFPEKGTRTLMNKMIQFCVIAAVILCGFNGVALGARCIEGDLDGSGEVNISDMLIFAEQWLDPAGCIGYGDDCGDLVGDDGVNAADFAAIANNWLKKCSEDIVITEIHYDPDFFHLDSILWN